MTTELALRRLGDMGPRSHCAIFLSNIGMNSGLPMGYTGCKQCLRKDRCNTYEPILTYMYMHIMYM